MRGTVENQILFEKISTFLKKFGAKKVFVFGSFARQEETANSDIDVLVEFKERKSLLELVDIEQKLTEVIGIKVDLLTEKAISPYLINEIKKEMIAV